MTLLLNLRFAGRTLRLTLPSSEPQELSFRASSEAFGTLEEVGLTVLVPGEGKATRFYPAPAGEDFDLRFLAVVKRRE